MLECVVICVQTHRILSYCSAKMMSDVLECVSIKMFMYYKVYLEVSVDYREGCWKHMMKDAKITVLHV